MGLAFQTLPGGDVKYISLVFETYHHRTDFLERDAASVQLFNRASMTSEIRSLHSEILAAEVSKIKHQRMSRGQNVYFIFALNYTLVWVESISFY